MKEFDLIMKYDSEINVNIFINLHQVLCNLIKNIDKVSTSIS